MKANRIIETCSPKLPLHILMVLVHKGCVLSTPFIIIHFKIIYMRIIILKQTRYTWYTFELKGIYSIVTRFECVLLNRLYRVSIDLRGKNHNVQKFLMKLIYAGGSVRRNTK